MRVVVYTDYVYRERDGAVFGERAFVLFLEALAAEVEQLTLLGRLDPGPGAARYRVGERVAFVALPHYASLTALGAVVRSVPRTVARMWRALGDADTVWTLGPYPHAIALALLGLLRRRRVVLGVRQDFPAYVRARRPAHRALHHAADVLEACWRLLARRCRVVTVGDDLAARYRHAPAVLATTISLIGAQDVSAGERAAARRDYEAGTLRLLSVGRLDAEKNPLLLADVLALLRAGDSRWRLLVCGEGDQAAALERRLAELGLGAHSELRGYVPLHAGLLELYRSSHVFLHVSWTEGLPQVLIEALASGLPTVATDVGGVSAFAGCTLLVPPGDARAAADATARLAADADLRASLIRAGLQQMRGATLEAHARQVAQFIAG